MNAAWQAEGKRQKAERASDGPRHAGEIVRCIVFCFVASALLGLVCAVCLVPFALL